MNINPLKLSFLQRVFYSFIVCIMMAGIGTLSAQTPKWFKKARKSQVNIITYDGKGQMLHSTNGFFVDAEGTAFSDYDSFRGAVRAVAIDEGGKEWPITHILGANSLYNVIKVKVATSKASPLDIANTQSQKGETVYVMPYLSNKSGVATFTPIEDNQTFNELYAYYTLPTAVPEKGASCPVLNAEGEVIGLLQMSANENDKKCYVVSAPFVQSLSINALAATSADYRDIPMRKALPDDAAAANTFIYLIGTRDTALYLAYVDDFIAAFPQETSGYTMKAEMLAAKGDYAQADETWNAGLKAKVKEAEILYSRARSTFGGIQAGLPLPEAWTLERATADIDAAIAKDESPVYVALKGHLLYAQKQYEEACNTFLSVTKTKMRDASYFLYAAQCKQIQGDSTATLALQDSAVACYTKPYPVEAAPSLLMRAQTHLSMGHHRLAVIDLNDYEHLKRNELNANFYYQREQAELRCRMYQQALSDIEQAARMEPHEPLFQAELAAVHYRFSQLDEAIIAARAAIALDDSFADAHRILGVCLKAQGKTNEARAALQKAVDLGDTMAKEILDKQ